MSTPNPISAAWSAADLAGMIAAATAQVKASPGDTEPRIALLQGLCFAAAWERAEKQLDGLDAAGIPPQATSVFASLIGSERKRAAFYSQGERPRFFKEPTEPVNLTLEAAERIRAGHPAEALPLLEKAATLRRELQGNVALEPRSGGEPTPVPFQGLRECDDLLAGVLEFFLPGSYGWIPWEEIRSLIIRRPRSRTDQLWIPAEVTFTDGGAIGGYVPALYAGSATHEDDKVKLGRMTVWKEIPDGPVLGVGQRLVALGENTEGVIDCRELHIDEAACAEPKSP